MAQRRHAVPHVGLGDHAPADARERRHSVLRALYGRAARRRGVSHRAGGTALEALGGARLLLAGAESQKAAKVIVSDFGGELPRTCASLKTLPGIGDYTAAAIASINFGEPVAAVDGNLLRVAARVSGCADDIMDAKVRKQFTAHLNDAIDLARPGAYNQAMMDLGATVCLPNGAPKCEICPARMMCEAYKNGLTEVLPVRAKKKARKIEERTVLLLFQNGKAALRKRADTGLLASLWEFPSVLGNLDEAGVSLVLAQMGLSAQTVEPAGSAKHIFTHIEWDMKGYFADVTGENDDLFWADAAAFDAAAIPTAFKKFAALVRARLQ